MKDQMYKMAIDFASRAYAPYSKFLVGASLKTKDGKLYGGCNIENSSYGGTVCAERVAILKAVSDGYKEFSEILVYTNSKEPWPPCSICQQTMAEFFDKDSLVHLSNNKGIQKTLSYGELNPFPFRF